jgi:S1-C subfamily serine protease
MSETQTIPVAAPIDSDSAGRGGDTAMQSVFRIISQETNSSGTGFLHKSGKIITAEHVVRNARNVKVAFSDGTSTKAAVLAADRDLDISVLEPRRPLTTPSLELSSDTEFSLGTHVSTWGFPGGYGGAAPILSAGYLSGIMGTRKTSGRVVKQWIVNAAFNSGNSGGPLLHIETGQVIGVVSSKLAPISPWAQSALSALTNQQSGLMYTVTKPDGTQVDVSEGQIVASILDELRQQVQLVIGMAVLLDDLTSFLRSLRIDP